MYNVYDECSAHVVDNAYSVYDVHTVYNACTVQSFEIVLLISSPIRRGISNTPCLYGGMLGRSAMFTSAGQSVRGENMYVKQ